MNAPFVLIERHCPNCRRLRPVEQFKSNRYCTDRKNAYGRNRYAEMKAGTWKPKPREEYATQRPRILPGAKVEPAPVPASWGAQLTYGGPAPVLTTADQEARLREALEDFMLEFGFTTLRVVYARLEGEVARKFRGTLAKDGWIA